MGKATKVEIRETECNINTVDASVSPEAVSDADKLKLFDLSHVPAEQKENLISVLKANIDVFVTKDSELTQTHVTEMVINTQGHLPIRQRPYRVFANPPNHIQIPGLQNFSRIVSTATILKYGFRANRQNNCSTIRDPTVIRSTPRPVHTTKAPKSVQLNDHTPP